MAEPAGDRRSSVDPRQGFTPLDRPWLEQPGWPTDPRYLRAPVERQAQASHFAEHGYVVLRSAVEPSACGAVIHATASAFDDGSTQRLTNAGWAVPAVRALADAPVVLDLLEFLYDRAPIPFQTLNFKFGTGQAPHRDDIHFDTLPPSYVCGVWIALEDVGPDQGPVALVPGTQVGGSAKADATPWEFTARAGDVLVWSATLVHGGAPIIDPKATRWSQVTHYVFDDAIYYTPLASDPERGALALRHPLLDIRDLREVTHRIDGRPARFRHAPGGRSYLLGPDEVLGPGARLSSAIRGITRRARRRVHAHMARATGRIPGS